MDSVLDFLFLRRLKFEYVTPPICPFPPTSASGTGIQGQVISPLLKMAAPAQLGRFLVWPCDAQQICYNIYFAHAGFLTEVASCIAPNSMVVCSAGTWKIAPLYGTTEGPTTDPVSAPGGELVTLFLPAGSGVTGYNVYFDSGSGFSLALAGTFCAAFETCTLGCYSISAITGDGETPISDPVCGAQPEITISAPTAGETFYACYPSITVTADVIPSGHTIDNVQFFEGATLLGTAASSPYSITWAGGTYGSHTLTAVLNYEGNTIESPSVTTNIQQFTPKTEDYAERVVINGGTRPVDATLCAIDTWYQGLEAAGISDLMISACIFKNDNRYAAATPFFNSAGLDPWFMLRIEPDTGTEVIANGMKSNLVSAPYCDTGCVPSTVYPSNLDVGYTLYAYDAANSANEYTAGCSEAGFARPVAIFDTGSGGLLEAFALQAVGSAVPPFKGFLSMNRNAATTTLYTASSTNPHGIFGSVGSVAGVLPTKSFYFFNINIGGTPGFYSLSTMSFAAIHRSMTQAQNSAFYNLTQSLLQTLGGGYR